MASMAAGYAFESALLFGFWDGGYIPLAPAVGFTLGFLVGWLLLCIAFLLGWNLRVKDRNLFMPQFAFSVAMCSAMMVVLPQISIQPLAIMSVIFVHGFAAPDRRSLVIAWTLAGLGVVAMILAAGPAMRIPSATPQGRAMILLVMVGCLVRCMGFATYVRQLQRSVRDKNLALKTALARNDELLHHDELTGVANRRSLVQCLAKQVALHERLGAPFCVALIDIDLFKQVNDRFGHLVGDKVLEIMAREIEGGTRGSDLFGRWGGEEFMTVLVASSLTEAAASLERARARVAAFDWAAVEPGLAVTITCGVAAFGAGDTVQSVIRRADEALYRGKAGGRNRVASDPLPNPPQAVDA
jgi:diguanylate cyclase (GGDEF)-like protein